MTKTKIIVTGSSSGLGKCIVEALYQLPDVELTCWDITGGVDVADEASVQRAIDGSAYRNKVDSNRLDILINCAGINKIAPFSEITGEDWDRIMAVNVKGIFNCSKLLLEKLRGGTILNIGSKAAYTPMTHSAVYNASKGAVQILTLQMARELWKTHGITVFGINPNRLKNTAQSDYITRRVMELKGWTKEEADAYQATSLSIGEETDPNALAEFIAFLLSKKDNHRYLHGTVLNYGN